MAASSAKLGEDLAVLKHQLYDACQEAFANDYERPLSQDDLMGLDVIPPKDIKTLLSVIQTLTKDRLFAPVNLSSGLAWRMRPESEAAKYKLLSSQEQTLVYEIIDNAGAEGAWQQDIKRRLNIQDNALRKALKELEAKRLVSQFTTVENATKKMWIKSNVKPSSRATGGPFYTDSFLDETLIEELQSVILGLVKDRGSYRSTHGGHDHDYVSVSATPNVPKKGIIRGSASEAATKAAAASKKRPADAMTGAAPPDAPVHYQKVKRERLLPLPAGYTDYVTTADIASVFSGRDVAKGQPLQEEHVQQLIDVLVWDGRLESVKTGDGRKGYRAVRIARSNVQPKIKLDDPDFWEPQSNGLTTVPCGRCPVFDICEEGGPVWAGGCEYFDQWLA